MSMQQRCHAEIAQALENGRSIHREAHSALAWRNHQFRKRQVPHGQQIVVRDTDDDVSILSGRASPQKRFCESAHLAQPHISPAPSVVALHPARVHAEQHKSRFTLVLETQ